MQVTARRRDHLSSENCRLSFTFAPAATSLKARKKTVQPPDDFRQIQVSRPFETNTDFRQKGIMHTALKYQEHVHHFDFGQETRFTGTIRPNENQTKSYISILADLKISSGLKTIARSLALPSIDIMIHEILTSFRLHRLHDNPRQHRSHTVPAA